jgi:branched-chain amino acid transport system ATP-binding protein
MSPIVRRLLLASVRRLQNSIDFETNYLPLRVDESKERLNATKETLKLRADKRLAVFERNAGVQSDAVSGIVQSARLKVERTYYWKRLEILKRRSDAYRQTPDLAALDETFAPLLKRLEEERLSAIEKATIRLFPQESDPTAIDAYHHAKTSIQGRLSRREQELQTVFERRVAFWQNRLDARVARWKKRLDALLNILAKYPNQASPIQERIEPDAILKLDSLSMHFGGLKAVDQLSFSVKRGEIFGLIGPNGAGKTTVFNCITRFYKATAGSLYYRRKNGDVVDLATKKVHDVIRLGIVRTFQNVEMVWELSILENLLVAAHTQYRTGFFGQLLSTSKLKREEKLLRKKAMDVLEDLGLEAYANFYPLGLPYGILKKVELARTLMANPDLIILDEPAAGLNDTETEGLKEIIRKIRDEYQATIFLVEHDMGLVMDVCDTVCAISFGKRLAIGKPQEIQTNKLVREAYLGGE